MATMATESYRNSEPDRRRIKYYVSPGSKIAVFDTETTGLKAGTDRIIQFSGIKYEMLEGNTLREMERQDFYINPEKPIPEKITGITGITDEMVQDMLPMSKQILRIKRFLESSDIWVGYNLAFDLRMLDGESDMCRVWIRHSPVIDAIDIARDYVRKGTEVKDYHLGTIIEYLFPDLELRYHDSLNDVLATAKLFEWGCRKAAGDTGKAVEPDINLNKAEFFVNPNKQSQKRIVLTLSVGGKGDIFYDVIDRQWSYKKSSPSAKKLFAQLLENDGMRFIEESVLSKYGFFSMDEMSDEWLKRESRKKKKN